MADYFVFNRTSPAPSAHRAGVRISTSAIDEVTDVINKYAAGHVVAPGDVLECVSAGSFSARTATPTIVFSTSSPATVLPAVGS